MRKKLVLLLAIVPFLLVIGAGVFVWMIINEPPPTFFPLDNPDGKYTVIKSSTVVQGWDEAVASDSADGPEYDERYYIEYRGTGVFMDDKDRNFFRILVGKSAVPLEPLVNKDIRIKRGKFVSSTQQCIVDRCSEIHGPFVALNVDSVEVVKK